MDILAEPRIFTRGCRVVDIDQPFLAELFNVFWAKNFIYDHYADRLFEREFVQSLAIRDPDSFHQHCFAPPRIMILGGMLAQIFPL